MTEFPVAERGEPVDFGGVTENGAQFSSDDTRGGVTVVNFWYAACGPCRAGAFSRARTSLSAASASCSRRPACT